MKNFKIWVVLVLFVVTGCKECNDEIVKDVVALGSVKLVVKRISGIHYINFSKPDAGDSYSENNGYLCVTHNPGCGWWGNNGSDKFFNADVPLPPLCTIVGTSFTQFWPNGVASSGAPGGLGGWGSYGAHLNTGSSDGSAPYVVSWNNACQGDFGGKNLYYHISFLVSMPEGTDMGEPVFDQTPDDPAVCLPQGYSTQAQNATPPTVIPSGFAGTAKYCNPTREQACGKLIIWATLVTALPGATGESVMKDTISICFGPGGGTLPVSQGFSTPMQYKQGTWSITLVKIIGLTGNLTVSTPITTSLPAGLGQPIFDFSNGSCLVQ
jgi:hypothetical protein